VSFAVGSLVRARGREWVVLPESEPDLLLLRPLGGTDDEVTGICTDLETVEPARFDLPDPGRPGDHRSCALLRDAVRLSSRAGAGPFRSFARIAVEPRPYQLVPLLLALKLDPIRLLIADDVGIGKTIEAVLIARELIDRGEAHRLAVLCPPHLAEQWQQELDQKFHVEAELVLPGTAARLERRCRVGQSLFDLYPHTVVSMDFIKTERRRDEFARSCPRLVIVDEAHTCASGQVGRGGRHHRHELVRKLAEDAERHMVLVTATPHSGKEEAFRSLLTLLQPEFADLPDDLTGPQNEAHRRRLAAHFVQRRRADIKHFLETDTPFPAREDAEAHYELSPDYRRLFEKVLDFARETVADPEGGRHRQRVRWWSALALLRSVASSPAAAAATLRNRAVTADTETEEEADEVGRRAVLDLDTEDLSDTLDTSPGADAGDETDEARRTRRRLLDLAREADRLQGDHDPKLVKAVGLVQDLLRDGYRPILFCRFIPTAEYLAEQLRKRLPRGTEVIAVTGNLPPADRETRVLDLAAKEKRVLVATDCLSEGINLQEHFDAVMHYDLSWSPTRHEQREGRVDRFGQPVAKVRVLTYYGRDNQIDGIVLDVLIRKHKTIRSSLGVSVPVPLDTNAVVESIFEGLLLRQSGARDRSAPVLPGFEEYFRPKKEDLFTRWEDAANREKRSRTLFAQESIKVDEVSRALAEARRAIGSAESVQAFVIDALTSYKGTVVPQAGRFRFDLREAPRALRDTLSTEEGFDAQFDLPVPGGVHFLSRTDPVVEGLAAHVMDAALDRLGDGAARRCGAIRTAAVERRTTLLLVRYRFDVVTKRGGEEQSQLAEEVRLLAFRGAPQDAEWLPEDEAERLLAARPGGNIHDEQKTTFVRQIVEAYDLIRDHLDREATRRSEVLLEAHRRVREEAKLRGVSYRVSPQLPPDVLGIYVFLPLVQN